MKVFGLNVEIECQCSIDDPCLRCEEFMAALARLVESRMERSRGFFSKAKWILHGATLTADEGDKHFSAVFENGCFRELPKAEVKP